MGLETGVKRAGYNEALAPLINNPIEFYQKPDFYNYLLKVAKGIVIIV